MVISMPINIRNKRGAIGKVEGEAYAEAPADSVQTTGGVHTLILDMDDPEDMLGSSLEDLEEWEAEHGGQDNAP